MREFSVFSILGIIFIVLKILGYITWSWFWVLSPFWIPVIFAFLILIPGFIALILWIWRK